tara:strand:+ start:336 stop:755 length:420 start_codon:yes stop_codon:yes gene_type:complete
MSYSPNLLKNLGIKLAMEFAREKRPPEIRLFQAILLQAFEDSLSLSGFKRETYWKEDSHKWFLENGKDFQDVCWNADMDPQMVREEYIKLIDIGKIKFTELQKSWINYREFYRLYRNAKTKEERAEIKRKVYSGKVKIK